MMINYDKLIQEIQAVFEAAGMTTENAAQMGQVLVEAEARGVYSHGVQMVASYINSYKNGTLTLNPEIKVLKQSSTTLLVDGGNGLGGISLTKAMDLAIAKAKEYGSATLVMVNCGHYGAGAYYVERAAREKLIGYLYANTPRNAIPFGGAERYLGTNPYSFAAPAGKYGNIVLDMATTETAAGKLRAAMDDGRQVPLGMGVDRDGNPTTDPGAIINGGALCHFGGVKGYGISFMINTVTGVLSGSAYKGAEIDLLNLRGTGKNSVSFFMSLVDISRFIDPAEFEARAEDFIEDIKRVKLAPGFQEIFFPGEIENRNLARALIEGVHVHDAAYEGFRKVAASLGVEL